MPRSKTAGLDSDRGAAAALSFLFFAVYWHGRCPTFGPGESPLLVLGSLVKDLASSAGHPLYIALGRAAASLPIGAPAGNVNGLSGFLHAAACGLFYLTLRKQGLRRPACVFAALLMGFSEIFWYYSEVAAAWALSDALALLAAVLALSWSKSAGPARLAILAAVLGLGLGQHWERLGCGPLASHGSWSLSAPSWALLACEALLAGLGAVSLWKDSPRTLAFWASWIVFGALGSLAAGLGREGPPLTPAETLLPGIGFFALAAFGAGRILERARPAHCALLIAAACALPLLRPIDLSRHNPLMEYARGLARGTTEGDILVLAQQGPFYALEYLDRVEGTVRGRILLSPELLASAACRGALEARHPGLKLPPGPLDWRGLVEANPARTVYGEAPFIAPILAQLPWSVPSGLMVRASARSVPRSEVARSAAAASTWESLGSIRRWDRYFFTEEAGLASAYRGILGWYLSFLGAGDEPAASRLKAHLRDL
ncbi:MAG: DUF2723 domain-containing protein [Elusimicrobia bacterium]|nr:DUF2723 domain-containing protein [Elusimicrobiota bacterium]